MPYKSAQNADHFETATLKKYGFLISSNIFEQIIFFEMYFWCDLYYKLLFLMGLSDSMSFSVYRNILIILFCVFDILWTKMSQKFEQFSYEICF